MTFPLMALAVGAVVAGFVGIPAALGGNNAIEHFLEPSFTASHHEVAPAKPATIAPTASAISGNVIGVGDSCGPCHGPWPCPPPP